MGSLIGTTEIRTALLKRGRGEWSTRQITRAIHELGWQDRRRLNAFEVPEADLPELEAKLRERYARLPGKGVRK